MGLAGPPRHEEIAPITAFKPRLKSSLEGTRRLAGDADRGRGADRRGRHSHRTLRGGGGTNQRRRPTLLEQRVQPIGAPGESRVRSWISRIVILTELAPR